MTARLDAILTDLTVALDRRAARRRRVRAASTATATVMAAAAVAASVAGLAANPATGSADGAGAPAVKLIADGGSGFADLNLAQERRSSD